MTAEEQLSRHFRLVLDNDEPCYWSRRGIVRDCMREADYDAQGPDSEEHAHAVSLAADRLKDAAEQLVDIENDENLMRREILNVALAHIDWRDIAADYIEEESE